MAVTANVIKGTEFYVAAEIQCVVYDNHTYLRQWLFMSLPRAACATVTVRCGGYDSLSVPLCGQNNDL